MPEQSSFPRRRRRARPPAAHDPRHGRVERRRGRQGFRGSRRRAALLLLLLPLQLASQFLQTSRFGLANPLELDVLWLRHSAVVARHDPVVRLAALAAVAPRALVLLGGADVGHGAGGGGPPRADAALAAGAGPVVGRRHCRRCGRVAHAQRRRRMGVRGAAGARQGADADSV